MSTLHIFNPSHDEALANGGYRYTPSKAARFMFEKFGLLPRLWCDDGDVVLVSRESISSFPSSFSETFPFASDTSEVVLLPYEKKELDADFWQRIEAIDPWGWDALLKHRLKAMGAPDALLPTDENLADIRDLSSRRMAVELLRQLRQDFPETVGESVWCTSMESVDEILGMYGDAMIKAPWSGSGRGVFPARNDEGTRRRTMRILEQQGAVEVEPLYKNRRDFALEYFVSKGGVVYEGLSVFETNTAGAYLGNIVATEEHLWKYIPQHLHGLLKDVRKGIAEYLEQMLPERYAGPLGVDMMIVEEVLGTLRLHPCIEVNMRRTMGYTAVQLRRYLKDCTDRFYFRLIGG